MALVVLANVTVPVVPDPNYLQQLYPSVTQPNGGGYGTFGEPVTTTTTVGDTAKPMDIAGLVSLAVTAGLGYFFQKNKTTMDRRTYMSADTAVKLAANDQASDVKTLNLVYAVNCIADIIGKYHKEDMETYMTRDGVSLWTYIEMLMQSYNQDFKARYVNTGPVPTTGTESKDKVVATFNKVQQSVTPSAPTPTPASTQTIAPPASQQVATGRVQANKTANEQSAAESSVKSTD
ncbi:MAG: hypothetical protein ACHQ1D_12190 [Nitrososphaerales archaeon]